MPSNVTKCYSSPSTAFGFLPASFNALVMMYSNCPLVLRNSSAAHFSTALSVRGSSRRTKGFFLDKGQLIFSSNTTRLPFGSVVMEIER